LKGVQVVPLAQGSSVESQSATSPVEHVGAQCEPVNVEPRS
jgi:hypothetical protein